MSTGIDTRHRRTCALSDGGKCNCEPSYRAWAYSSREGKKIRKTFPTLSAAKAWRADALVGLRKGTMRTPTTQTLRQAAEEWVEGAKSGTIRTRSGDRFKPSTLRGYEASLRSRILPELGGARLADVQRRDVQRLADRMLAGGCDASTIRNALMPLRVIYRRALEDGDLAVNPTESLRLPAVRGRRDRIASPVEATELLDALPTEDRALWATAFYAGLRRGELLGLRWDDLDLASGKINVERSWDERAGEIEPKSAAGRRTVPIPAVLLDYLVEHKLAQGREAGLVFGTSSTHPFTPSNIWRRARRAWAMENERRTVEAAEAGTKPRLLEPIGLHEARHTFASLMIAAGVTPKAISTYMGHSSISITLDRYGHLMPGNETEAAALLDAYLERADTAARLVQLESGRDEAGRSA